MFEFVMFAFFAIGVVAFVVNEVSDMWFMFNHMYLVRHINEEHHSEFGNYVFSKYKPEYVESLRKGEAC